MNKYDTIGIDLVAMSVNDLIVQGAKPLFFLDYIAVERIKKKQVLDIINGIAKGCYKASCSLVGGETAELPGLYQNAHFDLAGFAVGIVDKSKLLPKNNIKSNDVLIGLPSNGIHSNGFSLVRKIIEVNSIDIYKKSEFDKNKTLAEILMKPTMLYTKAFMAANKNYKVKSISHITGGGLIDNPPRAFNENLTLKFDMKNFKLPPLFNWLKDKANISLFELTKTFNCGIGFLIFVDKNDAQEIINDINKIGYNAFLIGSMVENDYEKNVVFDGWNF